MSLKKTKSSVAVAGSLAFDCVMNFPGRFSAHILPGKIHDLNVSFSLDRLSTGFGGTAGNIAYNLALLQERPSVLSAVGADFLLYRRHLLALGADLCALARNQRERCASAFIMTDKDDNQLSGFYPGPALLPDFKRLDKKNINYLIIAPDLKARMLAAQAWAIKRNLPYIFDPGQQVINFSPTELRKIIRSAFLTIGNDYEVEVIRLALACSDAASISPRRPLIITKGAQGSEIITANKRILIPAVAVRENLDPTGAGDAYRAGLLKGLVLGMPLVEAAKLASTVAVYAVEKKGTQNHRFTLKNLEKRYRQSFGQALKLT
jgi:adenosine kinase